MVKNLTNSSNSNSTFISLIKKSNEPSKNKEDLLLASTIFS